MIHDLKPYPAYKDSAVPWLGKVPEHWKVQRGKWLFRHKKQINADRSNSNILSLTLRGVVNNDPDNPEGLVPKDYASYQLFRKGDLVFKLIDLENLRTSRVGLVHEDGIMSPAYVRLVPQSINNIHYFFHQYFDLYQRGIYNQLGAGVRSTLSPGDLLNLSLLVPSLPEQSTIVRYIDYIDRCVRHFIHEKKKLIKLLEEQKQAIIQQAVFRGLDQNVKLKSSGVEWLDNVPEHWKVLRSRYVFHEVDERSTTGKETHLSMSQKYGLIRNDQIEERRLISESYIGAKICTYGDLVLNRLKAHLGVFALANEPGLVSPDYTVLRPIRDIAPSYFEFVYRTPACRVELRQRTKGIVQGFWRLYTDDFYQIFIPVPPKEEQESIVKVIIEKVRSVNEIIDKTLIEISLLREFRTRLIADVVTGKLDVREAAANIPEEAEEIEFREEELSEDTECTEEDLDSEPEDE